ncbi:MAG TPA: TolC family protein, partial [Vicinamibacterales bacterium]|nr:TolC family protein [Vicinamibacterales bacterium]
MPFEQRIPAWVTRATAVALTAILFTSGRGVSASEQEPAPRAAQSPTSQPTGPEQRITQDEAVRMALENNLGLHVSRLDPRIQALTVSRALSAYTPELFGNTARTSNTTPPTDFLSQGVAVTTSQNFAASGGIRQQLPWGASYSFSLNGSRSTSDAPRTPFSPQLLSDVSAIYNQPLLRNFSIDNFRQSVMQSRIQLDVTDLQLMQRITQTSRNVRNAYLQLVAAIASLDVAQQSLELAEQSLKNNQRRVEVGAMAPIDIVAAEAEVARNEEMVILRQGEIEGAEDQLRTLIMNPSQPDFWSTRLVPAEQPAVTAQPLDVDAAIKNALANRTDLGQLRKQMENVNLNIRVASNQKLPSLDLQARYGMRGVGGTQFLYGAVPLEGGPPPVLGTLQRGFGDVLGDVFGNDFRNWTVGVVFSYPLGTSAADASLAQSRLARQQTE